MEIYTDIINLKTLFVRTRLTLELLVLVGFVKFLWYMIVTFMQIREREISAYEVAFKN